MTRIDRLIINVVGNNAIGNTTLLSNYSKGLFYLIVLYVYLLLFGCFFKKLQLDTWFKLLRHMT